MLSHVFAAIQAARQCGVQPMMRAISDLTDQAVVAVEATKDKISYDAQYTKGNIPYRLRWWLCNL
jgi:hypothetical protein